jgi:hypothetical protein
MPMRMRGNNGKWQNERACLLGPKKKKMPDRGARLLPLFVYRAAAQKRIVLHPLDALLLQLLVLRREVTGSGLAFLDRLGAFQNNLFAHGI